MAADCELVYSLCFCRNLEPVNWSVLVYWPPERPSQTGWKVPVRQAVAFNRFFFWLKTEFGLKSEAFRRSHSPWLRVGAAPVDPGVSTEITTE